MAHKTGSYQGADQIVHTYQFRMQGERTSFVTMPACGSPSEIKVYMQGEYSCIQTRKRFDPDLGMVREDGQWRKIQ